MKDIVNLLLKPFNKHTKQILLFFVVVIFGFNVHSQNIKAEGTVLSEESGQPIPGVSVVIKGSSIGTSTNFDGLYNIKVSKGDILVFSYLGMEEIEIIVNKASKHWGSSVNPAEPVRCFPFEIITSFATRFEAIIFACSIGTISSLSP